jgi:rSAM/selenodomain-associated transferase 1
MSTALHVPPGTALVVMAKAPVPGLAKTRLIPALGAAGAARLAERFLDTTLNQAMAATAGTVTLSCAPSARHEGFARWAQLPRIELADQAEGDLGERMAAAFARAFGDTGGGRQTERVLLFGTDAPALDSRMLCAAAEGLRRRDAVFVPTFDGGYVLVGLTRLPRMRLAELFAPLPWSTSEVMALTRARLHALGIGFEELPAVADVDEPQDLVHLAHLGSAAPQKGSAAA